jgi:hypothetical protein
MTFSRIFQGSPIGLGDVNSVNPQSPLLGVDVVNEVLWINCGNGWVEIDTGGGGGGAQFSTLAVSPHNGNLEAATTGVTTYALPTASVNPGGSFYFVNGVKQVFGIDYSVTGSTLTILGTNPVPPVTGDFHEIYYS